RVEHYETGSVRKDGRKIQLSLSCFPFQDEGGHLMNILTIACDISSRNRLEQAERDQLYLASILSSTNDPIITKDLNGVVVGWNKAAKQLFRFTAEEMIGTLDEALIPFDRPDEGRQILEHVRRGDHLEQYETQRIRKDGCTLSVSLSMSPVKDVLGRVTGAVETLHDTTERMRLEAAERDQLFLASIVSSADDAIISKNMDGVVTSWNRSAEKLFGYSAEDIIGRPIALLVAADHPNEEPQILDRIRRGERIEHYETKRIRKDGKVVDVSLTISPIKDSMGRIVGASNIARDITDRLRWQKAEMAQSFLGALVESADDAIISKSLDGIVTTWNPAAERL